jgi:hypothetical protein
MLPEREVGENASTTRRRDSERLGDAGELPAPEGDDRHPAAALGQRAVAEPQSLAPVVDVRSHHAQESLKALPSGLSSSRADRFGVIGEKMRVRIDESEAPHGLPSFRNRAKDIYLCLFL